MRGALITAAPSWSFPGVPFSSFSPTASRGFGGSGLLCSSFHALGGGALRHPKLGFRRGLSDHQHPICLGPRRMVVRCLNRIMLEPCEVTRREDGALSATIAAADARAVHVRKVLNAEGGEFVRAGVIDAGWTDAARVCWRDVEESQEGRLLGPDLTVPLRKVGGRKAKKPQDLILDLGSDARLLERVRAESRPRVALMLALPRPLQLERILPMVSSLGVSTLVLCTASKVEKMYFGSHLFRDPESMREKLVEGLSQSGHTVLPEVVVVRRLKVFLEDELEMLFPQKSWARTVAHPTRLVPFENGHSNEREGSGEFSAGPMDREPGERTAFLEPRALGERFAQGKPTSAARFADVKAPEGCDLRHMGVVVAVGPEGGWEEPHELDLLRSRGFQAVTLGPRVLRSDVAVCALLALAHAWVEDQSGADPPSAPPPCL